MENLLIIYPQINDDYVIEFFSGKDGKAAKGKFKASVMLKHPGLKQYLESRFDTFDSYAETVYRIKNKIEAKPVCPTCGKPLPYYRNGYPAFCGRECYRKSDIPNRKRKATCNERYGCANPSQIKSVKEKKKETCLLRYGVEHYSKTAEFVEKAKTTCKEKFGEDSYAKTDAFRKRYAETCLSKYGTEHYSKTESFKSFARKNCAFLSDGFKDKAETTCMKKYGSKHFQSTTGFREKVKATCLERYGCEYVSQSEPHKEKTRATCLEKYGMSYYFQSADFKKKIEPIKNALYAKAAASKKSRGTFNSSSEEETVYKMLAEKFGEVKRQYRSVQYPFACDFYVPCEDLYIEYNGSWTHGKHPFDIEKDSEVLAAWIAKHSDYYTNAVNVWTVRDPLKRTTAKSNNLNFIELWSVAETEALIKK